MVLLVALAEVLLVLGWAMESKSFCSPTTFYKNCWIRRFPGLLIDLQESQRRGARVLKIYSEVSSQQCSRTCCLLKNVSCNLAVFFHGAPQENMNCLHMSCPALESCILKARINTILYNITAGMDPDLLIFEKLTPKEPNTRSSLNKNERQNSTKMPEPERCQQNNVTSSYLLPPNPSSATSHGLTDTFSTSLVVQKMEVTTSPRPETFLLDDHFAKKPSTTSVSTRSPTSSDQRTAHSTSVTESPKTLSHVPTPPRLNSSKQHFNDTKGYSGRNYSSENETPAWEAVALGVWLIPVVLCSSLIFLCCCTVVFASGCCRKRTDDFFTYRNTDTCTSKEEVSPSTRRVPCTSYPVTTTFTTNGDAPRPSV